MSEGIVAIGGLGLVVYYLAATKMHKEARENLKQKSRIKLESPQWDTQGQPFISASIHPEGRTQQETNIQANAAARASIWGTLFSSRSTPGVSAWWNSGLVDPIDPIYRSGYYRTLGSMDESNKHIPPPVPVNVWLEDDDEVLDPYIPLMCDPHEAIGSKPSYSSWGLWTGLPIHLTHNSVGDKDPGIEYKKYYNHVPFDAPDQPRDPRMFEAQLDNYDDQKNIPTVYKGW